MRAYSDVSSAHAVESRRRDHNVDEVDKRFNNIAQQLLWATL